MGTTGHRVFEQGPGPKRQKGHPKPVVTFRPPKDLEVYLDEGEAKGNPKSDVIIGALRIRKDASEAMGVDWWEIARRANVEGVSMGTMLGRLAATGLHHESKGKRGH